MAKKRHPLGVTASAWRDMTSKHRATLADLEAYDLDFLVGDPMHRQRVMDRGLHVEALPELKKFFAVKVICEPHPLVLFAPIIAAAWHAFILDTQRYEEFCTAIYGKTIHHIPRGGAKKDENNFAWFSIYREWFGLFPRVWKLDVNGLEIPGHEQAMNGTGFSFMSDHDNDSDDGAFAILNSDR